MPSQGPLSPANAASQGTGVAWGTPTNAKVSDNAYATSNLTDTAPTSAFLRTTGYGFSIPPDTVITGIVVEVEVSKTLSSPGTITRDSNATLRGGTGTSNNLANGVYAFTGTDTYISFGLTNNITMWGMTFSYTQVNSATFGFDFKAVVADDGTAVPPYGSRARVDHIRITVYYREAGNIHFQTRFGYIIQQSLGPLSGGTFATSGGAGIAWTSPGDAVSSNDARTRATLSDSTELISEGLSCTNFAFSTIPIQATIRGIKVEIERSTSLLSSGAFINDSNIQLLNGTGAGTNKASATAWPTSDAYATYGDSTDLWGQAWTRAQVVSSSFGVSIKALLNQGTASSPYSGQARIDHVRITVYYSI